MVAKSNTELLIESPEAMRRFCEGLEREATVGGIDIEIGKISDRLRLQLGAARACGLDPDNLLEYCRAERHEWLLIFATAVGTARGKRIGKQAGERSISEARTFGVLQAQNIRLLKPGVGLGEDD